MRSVFSFITLFFLVGVSNANDWKLTSVIQDESVDAGDVSRIKKQYPDHMALINKVALSYSYYVGVRTETWRWNGRTKCPSGDPSLTTKILSVSYGATMKNQGSVAEVLFSRHMPLVSDPCN